MSFKTFRKKRGFENIDVIVDSGGKAYNLIILDRFLDNVKLKIPDSIRILIYDVEGQPGLRHLFFYKGTIIFIHDNTKKEPLLEKAIEIYSGDRIIVESSDSLIKYYLYDGDEHVGPILAIDKELIKK